MFLCHFSDPSGYVHPIISTFFKPKTVENKCRSPWRKWRRLSLKGQLLLHRTQGILKWFRCRRPLSRTRPGITILHLLCIPERTDFKFGKAKHRRLRATESRLYCTLISFVTCIDLSVIWRFTVLSWNMCFVCRNLLLTWLRSSLETDFNWNRSFQGKYYFSGITSTTLNYSTIWDSETFGRKQLISCLFASGPPGAALAFCTFSNSGSCSHGTLIPRDLYLFSLNPFPFTPF